MPGSTGPPPFLSAAQAKHMSRLMTTTTLRKVAPWGVFAAAAGAWLVFPTLTEGFKKSPFGLLDEDDGK